jgi:hypothetical protein
MKSILYNKKRPYTLIAIATVVVFMSSLMISLFLSQRGAAQTPAVSPSPAITARMDDDNSLIFHIQGSVEAPGNVMVEYSSDGTGAFVTPSEPTTGTNFSIEVMRLLPQTEYSYRVYLAQNSGSPALRYQGSFITGPLPVGLVSANFTLTQGAPTYNLVLLDFNDTDFNGVVAIDGNNQIVWYYQHDKQVFTLAQEANYNLVFNEISMVNGYSMYEIAPDGRKLVSVNDTLDNGSLCQPHGRWHHEMLIRPNNKVWTLGEEIRPVSINGTNTLQTGATIEEWDMAAGTVTRLVSLFDIMDPVKDRTQDSGTIGGFFWQGSRNQYTGETQDWTHANSLDILPNGNILMSLRHLNQVIAIKPDFSGIAWQLGGPESDFSFPNPNDQFYHQHFAHMLPNGHILLFDNGNLRPAEQGGQYSRALELALNFDTLQAVKVWEYRNTPDLYASAVGSVVRMDNGNTLTDFGADDVNNPKVFHLVEVDPQGKPVASTQIISPGKNIQYRALPVDSLNGETLISAPAQP